MKDLYALLLLFCWLTSCSGEKKESIATYTTEKTITKSSESQSEKVLVKNQLNLNKNNIWDNVNDKANWFKSGLKPQTDLKLIPQDFLKFYDKFIKDSLFQKNHIQYSRFVGV